MVTGLRARSRARWRVQGRCPRFPEIEDCGEISVAFPFSQFGAALTLGEIVAKPLKADDGELMRHYEHTITANAAVLPFDQAASAAFAAVHHNRSTHSADAMQLDCAAVAGVDMFIINDQRLNRHVVPGIHFIQSLGGAKL